MLSRNSLIDVSFSLTLIHNANWRVRPPIIEGKTTQKWIG